MTLMPCQKCLNTDADLTIDPCASCEFISDEGRDEYAYNNVKAKRKARVFSRQRIGQKKGE